MEMAFFIAPAAREEVRKVSMDSHVDQTFLIEVPFPSDARRGFSAMRHEQLPKLAPKLAPGKDFYAQKNRSVQ